MRVLGQFLALATLLTLTLGAKDKTVTQYLRDSGYTVLSRLLTDTGLDQALDSNGPFTVFAPKDDAFALVDNATLVSLSTNIPELTRVLQYHVLPEYLISPMINGSEQRMTLEGENLNLTLTASGRFVVNDIARVVKGGDTVVKNGVIHPIDHVLLPPPRTTTTIAQYLVADDARFKDLFMALLLEDLTTLLQGGEFTLFAPVNAAFVNFRQSSLAVAAGNATQVYKEVLEYHVVPGRRPASSLQNGGTLLSLRGTRLNVTINAAGVKINNGNVIDADIELANGIIHAMDTVLIPDDLRRT